jgi:hypothetical protein
MTLGGSRRHRTQLLQTNYDFALYLLLYQPEYLSSIMKPPRHKAFLHVARSFDLCTLGRARPLLGNTCRTGSAIGAAAYDPYPSPVHREIRVWPHSTLMFASRMMRPYSSCCLRMYEPKSAPQVPTG